MNDFPKSEKQSFEVTISEILQKTVSVEAMSGDDAKEIVSDAWYDSKHILDADNFVEVEFEVTGTKNNSS